MPVQESTLSGPSQSPGRLSAEDQRQHGDHVRVNTGSSRLPISRYIESHNLIGGQECPNRLGVGLSVRKAAQDEVRSLQLLANANRESRAAG